MSARSTIAALAALAATGCWPVIPGKADDYILPETALVTGSIAVTTPLGDYWDGAEPSATAYWGVLTEPTAITGVEGFGATGTCTRNPAASTLLEGLRTGGSGTTRLLSGDKEIRLTWFGGSNLYFADTMSAVDYLPSATYDLAPAEFADLGTIDIPGFMTTTGTDLVVTSPAGMDGAEPPTVSGPEALAFEWTSEPADYAVINVQAVNASQQVVETVSCLVDDKGSFTVPADLFEATASTSYVIVTVGSLELEGGTTLIGGADQGYVTSATWMIVGALRYGAP